MAEYSITISHKDVEAFRAAYYELYPTGNPMSSRRLLFARTFEVDITEEDYLFLSLKFKFIKTTMILLKPRVSSPKSFIKFLPDEQNYF